MPASSLSCSSSPHQQADGAGTADAAALPKAVLVYHESAHSIVFRDQLRRQQSAIRRASTDALNSSRHRTQNVLDGVASKTPFLEGLLEEPSDSDTGYESSESNASVRLRNPRGSAPTSEEAHPVVIANFQPVIEPLDSLDLSAANVFEPLLDADPLTCGDLDLTEQESEVTEMLRTESAVVKTVRNADWTSFLAKFKPTGDDSGAHTRHFADRQKDSSPPEKKKDLPLPPYNSFVTSTSLLPSCGKKMRCFGSNHEYAVGVIFALPDDHSNTETEDEAAKKTKTWSWPSGYSAKTEFNINDRGELINGRQEALVPLSGLRNMNHSYLHDKDYVVGGRMVKGGLNTVPYNEVYIRVGGFNSKTMRSFDCGIGLPVALFSRDPNYGHLVQLLRVRARFSAMFGSEIAKTLPLLLVVPELGMRVFTKKLQQQVLKKMATSLNPFQNPAVAHFTRVDSTSEPHMKQKLEELLDLDDENVKQVLTPEEMARIAGGFGATDESVSNLLNDAALDDSGSLQGLVNEGLAFALRSNDYHTSRQLLILYSIVASRRRSNTEVSGQLQDDEDGYQSDSSSRDSAHWRKAEKDLNSAGDSQAVLFNRDNAQLGKEHIPPPPPPPPLDTDRLRSATNSDGLLAVLGAAQVLRAMQNGSAKRKVKEAIDSVDEWIHNGEQSVAFRVSSWRDLRSAQHDLNIATESDSNFMAFVSGKAITNRKKFVNQLREAADLTEFDSLRFLKSIHSVLSQMRSPCLRLELLQYILGLDNRYSVAHVLRSVELAATCLNLSGSDVHPTGL